MASDFFNSSFYNDPFFGMHRERLRSADDAFVSFFSSDPLLSLTDGSGPQRRQRGDRSHARDRGGSTDLMMMHHDPFESMNLMMNNMRSAMGNLSRNMNWIANSPDGGRGGGGGGHVYAAESSSVMSFSNNGNGPPKIYQATTTSKQFPGGLRETRKAVRDSEMEMEKMAIGRKIVDRGNVITRQRNTRTGDVDENRDYINMDEEDVAHFDREWQERTEQFYRNPAAGIGHQRNPRALGDDSAGNRTGRGHNLASLEAPKHHKRNSKYK